MLTNTKKMLESVYENQFSLIAKTLSNIFDNQ